MANWLNKYEQGGLILKKKTKDNFGKKFNPNDVQASVGPGFVGMGNDITGRNYSPAWGGQFQNGGLLNKLEKSVNSSLGYPMDRASKFAEVVAPEKKYNRKSKETVIVGRDNIRHPFAGRATAEAIQDKFSPWMQYTGIPQLSGFVGATALGIGHELGTFINDPRPTYTKLRESGEDIFNNTVGAFVGSLPIPSESKTNKLLELSNKHKLPDGFVSKNYQMGGALPGAVGFMYARTQNPAPSNGKYAKKTKASAQNGKEMQFYQEGLDFTPKTISQNGLLMSFEPEKVRQDATRVAAPVRPLTKKEQEENAKINKANQKKTEERNKNIVAERQANKNTKGDLSTPGSWHTADKLRLFPGSVGGVGEMFDEYVNPAYLVGSLTDQLGESVARRDIGGVAKTLGLTAGLGALGVDPLGDVMKAQRWSQKAVNNLGYDVQTAGPRLGGSARNIEPISTAERAQQQLDLVRQQRLSEAVSQGSQRTRVPYQFPTDEELAAMNVREAERYAPRVSRQAGPTPEDMAALNNYPVDRDLSQQLQNAVDDIFTRVTGRNVSRQAAEIQPISDRLQRAMEDINESNLSISELASPDPIEEYYTRHPASTPRVSRSDQMIDQMNQSRSTLSNLGNESTTTPKWGENNVKIGDATGTASHTDAEGNSFSQHISNFGNDYRSGQYTISDPNGGYMKLGTYQDLTNPDSYLKVTDMTFKNDVDASAAKQFQKIMTHLPAKVEMGNISTSMYSQPLMNQQVARWANGQPGRIVLDDIETEVLNPWHKGMDTPYDPVSGYAKHGDYYDQIVKQFPKLQKTVKSMSEATGQRLPEPELNFFDMDLDVPRRRPMTMEELTSPEFKKRIEQNPTLARKLTIKSPKYTLTKHWKNGGHFIDAMGQWAHPGDITTIPSNDITMKGVNYDVLGVSNTGDKKLMKPGKNYKFDGDYVTEYPKGGWLNKYK